MANTATIQVRVDQKTKTEALGVLDNLHINMSEAIKMFLQQIVLTNSIPFDLRVPNKLTAKTLDKVEAGKDLHEVSGVKELFEELNS